MADDRDAWAALVIYDVAVTDGVARTAWAIREHVDRSCTTIVGIARLARDRGVSTRTIDRHLAALCDAGYLVRVDDGGVTTDHGTTSLTVLALDGVPVTSQHSAEGAPAAGTLGAVAEDRLAELTRLIGAGEPPYRLRVGFGATDEEIAAIRATIRTANG